MWVDREGIKYMAEILGSHLSEQNQLNTIIEHLIRFMDAFAAR